MSAESRDAPKLVLRGARCDLGTTRRCASGTWGLWWLFACLLPAALPGTGRAQDEPPLADVRRNVLVLPLQRGPDLEDLDLILAQEAAAVLGHRLSPGAGPGRGCPGEDWLTCAVNSGRRAGAQLVVLGSASETFEGEVLELVLVDVRDQSERGRLRGAIPAAADARRALARELLVRLCAPEQYVGALHINGLLLFDRLVVDGAQQTVTPPAITMSLAVGEHIVEVKRKGAEPIITTVHVAFGEGRALDLGSGQLVENRSRGQGDGHDTEVSAGAPAASTAVTSAASSADTMPPMLALGLLGGGGAGLLLGVGVLAHVLAYTSPTLGWYRDQRDGGVVCPTTAGGGTACFDDNIGLLQGLLMAEGFVTASLFVAGATAIGAGVVVLVLGAQQPAVIE